MPCSFVDSRKVVCKFNFVNLPYFHIYNANILHTTHILSIDIRDLNGRSQALRLHCPKKFAIFLGLFLSVQSSSWWVNIARFMTLGLEMYRLTTSVTYDISVRFIMSRSSERFSLVKLLFGLPTSLSLLFMLQVLLVVVLMSRTLPLLFLQLKRRHDLLLLDMLLIYRKTSSMHRVVLPRLIRCRHSSQLLCLLSSSP